ncbi:hypothetical protein QAD02_008910 [Eretmocerus hayati]|uniref:Uncharacterized protein n=1 Tax=Eretmocerus hayati TaxID=131215 RepID=A0ACC2N935_9HYME|nr:hypothetical protein QAD02_008910 [Eretmocerus hayati]
MGVPIWVLCFASLFPTVFCGNAQSIDGPPTYKECHAPPPKYYDTCCYHGIAWIEVATCNQACIGYLKDYVRRASYKLHDAGECRGGYCRCKWSVPVDAFSMDYNMYIVDLEDTLAKNNKNFKRKPSVDAQRCSISTPNPSCISTTRAPPISVDNIVTFSGSASRIVSEIERQFCSHTSDH